MTTTPTDRTQWRHVLTVLAVTALVLGVAFAAPAAALQDDGAEEEPAELPAAFSGSVTIDGDPAPAGTQVTAVVDGAAHDTVETDADGGFGGTAADDALVVAASPGDKVQFHVDGRQASIADDGDDEVTWRAGAVQRVELSQERDSNGGGNPGGGGGFFSGGGGLSGPSTGNDLRIAGLQPADVTVTRGETVEFAGTVANDGGDPATTDVEIVVGGDTEYAESVTVSADEEQRIAVEVGTERREPDVYRVEFHAAGQTEVGALYVTAGDGGGDDDDGDGDDGGEGRGDDGTGDDGDDDSTPGFGPLTAAVALLSAAALGWRRAP